MTETLVREPRAMRRALHDPAISDPRSALCAMRRPLRLMPFCSALLHSAPLSVLHGYASLPAPKTDIATHKSAPAPAADLPPNAAVMKRFLHVFVEFSVDYAPFCIGAICG